MKKDKAPLYTHFTYKDAKGEWRWRVTHRNGNIVADSGEGYKKRGDAVRAFKRLTDAARFGLPNLILYAHAE